MARIHDLIRQLETKDPSLAEELSREVRALSDRRAFGLNFERHTPEQVELPGRPVRKGDKVHVLPPRGELPKKENNRIWFVSKISRGDEPLAKLIALDNQEETREVAMVDLVVVAEFRDPIYAGLVSTGKVERGGEKPFHTVINGENFHALEALMFTHRGKVDAIYIDPPYNTGARDWKYNNDYVEADDLYRHSKWLAFMERRLLLAKQLLNPEDSVLIITIDEKEYLRLGLLLEQIFPESNIQMVTSVINPSGSSRQGAFSRSDEYIFFVFLGNAELHPSTDDMLHKSLETRKVRWDGLVRRGATGRRSARPNLFYPIYLERKSGRFVGVGSPLDASEPRENVQSPEDVICLFPLGSDGSEMTWGISYSKFSEHVEKGFVKFGAFDPLEGRRPLYHLQSGTISAIEAGSIEILGRDEDGTLILAEYSKPVRPMTTWNKASHSAGDHGSSLLRKILPGRSFPFPKSLYAVEDALRFFVSEKPDAVILDFFSGSGTTAHAVMRINRQDRGNRQVISITNNEVSAEEQHGLISKKLRPGDPEWEQFGICDYITKPRIYAVVSGLTPGGEPIDGDYKFTDEFPMSDGFEENVEFFTLTYESQLQVASNRAFERIAPLLWMRAGSRGRRIESISSGWDVAESYGILFDLDFTESFIQAVIAAKKLTHAFIYTEEDRLFESVARALPFNVEVVRMNDSYFRNAELEAMAITR